MRGYYETGPKNEAQIAVDAVAKPCALWSQKSARVFVRKLEAWLAPIGYHVGLTGSCLYGGGTGKDIDVIVYPHCSGFNNWSGVENNLEAFGLKQTHNAAQLRKIWADKGSADI